MPELTKEQLYMILGIILIVLIGCVYGIYSKNTIITQSSPASIICKGEVTKEPENAVADGKTGIDMYVHVTGAVKSPGIYRLNKGDRLLELLKIAGVASNADLDGINLAEILTDSQKINIPNKRVAGYEGQPQKEKAAKVSQKININTADAKELDSLPGIGLTMAKRIFEYREQKGKFSNIEELKEVQGISEKKYEKLKSRITVN